MGVYSNFCIIGREVQVAISYVETQGYHVSSPTFLLYLTTRHAFWAIELEVLTKPVLPISIVTDEQGGLVIKLGEHAFARDSTLPSILQ